MEYVALILPHLHSASDMTRVYVDILRPMPELLPSEFAARYRYLKEGTTEQPGRWSNDVFPYLVDIMDAVREALLTGKRGIVLMKSGQGGGSEAIINALCWLLTYYPGPALYLISKDELANEFGRERFGPIVETCEPLSRKALRGKGSGELIRIKRFADGKLVISGGRSVLNLQSVPYKFVVIDEVDSLLAEIEGEGDPVKLAEIRMDSFGGPTLMIAFAHPSTRARGAGKLYYDLSDQRRGHVVCVHCGKSFWLQWDHVRAIAEEGMNQAQADRDPRCYHYFAPCCGAEISDAQRFAMIRHTRQRSVLADDVAARKTWIGVHFSQLYMPSKPLAFLAEKWIEGIDSEATKRVVVNKRLGDVYDAAVTESPAESWRGLVCISRGVNDPEYYELGQVPRGVRFLTAGQDSRETELHWTIWGWGLLRDEGNYPTLCGWLIDAGVVARAKAATLAAADLRVFDQLLYDRAFTSVDGKYRFYVEQGFHDSSWQPIAVYDYCRQRPFKAFPIKGAAVDSTSNAPFLRWGARPRWRSGTEEILDDTAKLCLLNTYTLKEAWYGLVAKRFKWVRTPGMPAEPRSILTLPRNVDSVMDARNVSFIEQSSNEYLAVERKALVWKKKGDQHWHDCNIYAYAAALNSDPFQAGLPFEDAQREMEKRSEAGYVPGQEDE